MCIYNTAYVVLFKKKYLNIGGGNLMVKVGITSKPKSLVVRYAHVGILSPKEIKTFKIEKDLGFEHECKRAFLEYNVRGEWYIFPKNKLDDLYRTIMNQIGYKSERKNVE